MGSQRVGHNWATEHTLTHMHTHTHTTKLAQMRLQLFLDAWLCMSLSACFTVTGLESPPSLTRNTPGISALSPGPADPQFTEESTFHPSHLRSVSRILISCSRTDHPPGGLAAEASFFWESPTPTHRAVIWPCSRTGQSHIPSWRLFYIK